MAEEKKEQLALERTWAKRIGKFFREHRERAEEGRMAHPTSRC